MAALQPIRKDADIRQDWRTINALVRELSAGRAEIRRLSGAVDELRRKLQHISPAGSTGNIRYRGEYSDLVDYVQGDLIVMSYGHASGSYICTADVEAVDNIHPWDGDRWAMIGKGIDQGNWV